MVSVGALYWQEHLYKIDFVKWLPLRFETEIKVKNDGTYVINGFGSGILNHRGVMHF